MDIEKVSLAAYEAQSSRIVRIVKYMALGWAMSIIAMGLVLVIALSYSEEVVTETTETVTQDSGDYGNNHYIGGDLNGEANYYPQGNDNKDGEERTSSNTD